MSARFSIFLSLIISCLPFSSQANDIPTESTSALILLNSVPDNYTLSETDADKPSKPQIVSAYFDEVWNDSYQDLDYNESVFHFSFTCGDFDVSKCLICVYSGPYTWDMIDEVKATSVTYCAEFESSIDNIWTYKMTGITWGEFFQIGIYNDSIGGGWSDLRLSTDYLSEDCISKINEYFDNILSVDEIKNDDIGFNLGSNSISFSGNVSDISSISLIDISGRTVCRQHNAEQINISSLSHGIYILYITTESGTPIIHKIII